MEQTVRPLGGPSLLVWTAPAGPPIKSFSFKGSKAMRQGSEWFQRVNQVEDRGGLLCWTAAPANGKLPVTKRRRLGDGLEVLASDDVLPLYASTADGWLLRQSGKLREPDPIRDCPGWLLETFGAKW